MNTLGPYLINPYQNAVGAGGITPSDMPIIYQLGSDGFIEVINYSPYFIVLRQTLGVVTQDPFCKAIYKTRANQGIQTLQITVPAVQQTQFSPQSPALQPQASYTNSYLYVNLYEENETVLYAPIPLVPLLGETQFISSAGTFPLEIPTTGTRFGHTERPISYVDGFDLCGQVPSSTAQGTLTITNLLPQDSGSTTLFYQVATVGGQPFQPLIVRFPRSITNDPSTENQITFNVPNLNNFFTLNVYYHLR